MDYNDKLRLAKEALDSGSYDKKTIEYIFPELAESEDERIRKGLIHLVKSNKELSFGIDNYDGIKWSDILAWLERQGEQKPAWSEKDIFKIQRICKYLDNAKKYYADITEVRECIDWLKSLKDRTQPQWKPSKEQMETLWNVYQGGKEQAELAILYNDLKKLREGYV